jgi:hypothetical protein
MAAATLICLIATALAMTDTERFATFALLLFALAWLVFFGALLMPATSKNRAD